MRPQDSRLLKEEKPEESIRLLGEKVPEQPPFDSAALQFALYLVRRPCRRNFADPGPKLTGSSADPRTADRQSPGQLNPELSRWLQGYPAEWAFCGAMVTRSLRKSP